VALFGGEDLVGFGGGDGEGSFDGVEFGFFDESGRCKYLRKQRGTGVTYEGWATYPTSIPFPLGKKRITYLAPYTP
jgi:hypothetical protein